MGDVEKGIKSFKKGISENPDLSNKDTEDKNNLIVINFNATDLLV